MCTDKPVRDGNGTKRTRGSRTRDRRTHEVSDLSKSREIHVKDEPVINRVPSITSITGVQLAKLEPRCGTKNRSDLVQLNKFCYESAQSYRITIFYTHSKTFFRSLFVLISECSCLMFGPIFVRNSSFKYRIS